MIYYIRDDNNSLLGFKYDGETYYYKKNAQEDIIGIYNSQNEQIVTYEYDSWGKVIGIKDASEMEITDRENIAYINPFRYRSYYYDEETSLYYLNSRYYNPMWGRFISIDNYIGVGKDYLYCNLYLYTNNNYINKYDYSGNLFGKLLKKIKNVTKKVAVAVEKVVNNVKIAAKKTSDFLSKSFTAEVGVGFGAGVSASFGTVEAGAQFTKTFNFGISDQAKYSSTTTSLGGDVGISEHSLGLSLEVTHFDDYNRIHDNVMAMPWEVLGCPNTKVEKIIAFTKYDYNDLEITDSGDTFVGVSFDLFAVVGVHLKIGFNF